MTGIELHGIAHELKFWKGFVKTDRFLKGWVADIKTPELHQETYDFIKSVPHDKVLDVGSGVVSILNGTIPKDNLYALDPLGELYETVFDYKHYGIRPPKAIPAEELAYTGYFDIVHCSNALDHTQNIEHAATRIYEAVKPGGYLILQGFTNEATFENWQGFHQWDICIDQRPSGAYLFAKGRADEFYLFWNPLKFYLKTLDNKEWYIWIVKKQ